MVEQHRIQTFKESLLFSASSIICIFLKLLLDLKHQHILKFVYHSNANEYLYNVKLSSFKAWNTI